MLLAIDIGNTHTVFGVYNKSKLLGNSRVTSFITRTEDEMGILVKNFCNDLKIPLSKIKKVGISSVVPNLTDVIYKMSLKYFKINPVIVDSTNSIGINILYDDPRTVGADRICNAVAAYSKYKTALIIVDFGTATTFDVVNKNGEYLGGVITVGIETSGNELHRRAALLPKVNLKFPKSVIGKNTSHALQSGILFSALDAMESMIKRIKDELGEKVFVIATGGFSELMSKHSSLIKKHEPNLVLEGIRIITEKVWKN
ncbi:MAG: type III pantothenate kinase [Bacteroidetes bacterium]|nr:type III pantothenate kinase [Bacteroidota bacterium]